MLQLSGSISFRMNIGNLLHFEASFQADGIIHASANKEDISGVGEFCRKPLDAFLVFQNSADFIRQGEKFPDVILIFLRSSFSFYR